MAQNKEKGLPLNEQGATHKNTHKPDNNSLGTTIATSLQDKGRKNSLPYQQNRVFSYLLKAQTPQSVADIAKAIGVGDARGHIAVLRRKGYAIGDIWCKSIHRGRYKRYFVRKEVVNE